MDIEQPVASTSAQPLGSADIVTSTAARPLAHTKGGRTAGKAHKSEKTALRRSYISPALKTPFEKRMERQKEKDAVKAVEKEMKDEQEAERERKSTAIKDRRARQAEKLRTEQQAAKMSAKKMMRLKKRQGRTKKING